MMLQECYKCITSAPIAMAAYIRRQCPLAVLVTFPDLDAVITSTGHQLADRCCKGVTRVLQVCCKGVTRVLQDCYKGLTFGLTVEQRTLT
jgi:hypothetical protein